MHSIIIIATMVGDRRDRSDNLAVSDEDRMRMRTRHAVSLPLCAISLGWSASVVAQQSSPPALQPRSMQDLSMAEAGQLWESQGVQVGEYLDDTSIYTLEGKSMRLAPLWKDRPVLLVSASLTCPVARRQCPMLQTIIDAHNPEVRVILLYTIDAHPQGDPSPYTPDREWITPQNHKDAILHPQPKTLDDRLALAKDMDARLKQIAPMYVDAMDNAAWKAMGGAPNLGLLIDTDGKVFAKQGWLNAKAMAGQVDALLAQRNEAARLAYDMGQAARPRMEAFIDAAKSDDRSKMESFFAADARIWFDQKTGPGSSVAVSPWRAWDDELHAQHVVESAAMDANTVRITSTETNDFARLIDFPGWRATSTYWFNGKGEITAQLYEPMDTTPSFRESFKPALEWTRANRPGELHAIYPNNDFAPSADTAKRWRAVLIEWRQATGKPAIEAPQ